MNYLWESVKEPLRWFVLWLASQVVVYLFDNVPGLSEFFSTFLCTQFIIALCFTQAQVAGGLTVILRVVDGWLHKKGKEEGKTTLVTGLTRF